MEATNIELHVSPLVLRIAATLAAHQGLPNGYKDKNFDDWELARLLAASSVEPLKMFRPDPGEDEGKITLKTMVDYSFHRFREKMIEQSAAGAGVMDILGTEAAHKAFVSAARDSLAMAGRHMLSKVEKVGLDE